MKISIDKSLQLEIDPEKNKKVLAINLGSENIYLNLNNLDNKKIYKLNTLKPMDKLKYIMSLAGVKSEVKTNKKNFNEDPLEDRKNHFLNLLKKRCDTTQFKKPLTKDFHFGIEIECFISKDNFDVESSTGGYVECHDCSGSGELTYTHHDSGSEIEGDCPHCENGQYYDEDYENDDNSSNHIEALQKYLKNKGITGLHVKDDGSIDPEDNDFFTVEIACLTTDFKNLEKLCRALVELEAKVNTSCGLHVHLDMRNKSNAQIEVIQHNLNKSLNILFAVVPKSRRTSNYCQKRVATEKYSAFNTGHLDTYGTIECRLHSGSTDFEKIKNWCLVLKSIVDRSTKVTRKIKYPNDFKHAFLLQDVLTDWLQNRYSKFTGEIDPSESLNFEESEAS